MPTFFFGVSREDAGELRLKKRFPAGDRQSRRLGEEWAESFEAEEERFWADLFPTLRLPGFRVMAEEATNRAALEEDDTPGAWSVEGAETLN